MNTKNVIIAILKALLMFLSAGAGGYTASIM